jgi:hypothetical protein
MAHSNGPNRNLCRNVAFWTAILKLATRHEVTTLRLHPTVELSYKATLMLVKHFVCYYYSLQLDQHE